MNRWVCPYCWELVMGGNFMINRPFETMFLSQHPSFVAPSEHSWNSNDELPLGGGDSLSSSSLVPPFCCQHGVDWCIRPKKKQPQNAAWTTEPLAFGANLRTGSQEGSHTMAYIEEPWAHSSETLQDLYFQNSCFGKWPFMLVPAKMNQTFNNIQKVFIKEPWVTPNRATPKSFFQKIKK